MQAVLAALALVVVMSRETMRVVLARVLVLAWEAAQVLVPATVVARTSGTGMVGFPRHGHQYCHASKLLAFHVSLAMSLGVHGGCATTNNQGDHYCQTAYTAVWYRQQWYAQYDIRHHICC